MFCGLDEHTVTAQGASLRAHIDYTEAMKRLAEIDILVIPGGGTYLQVFGRATGRQQNSQACVKMPLTAYPSVTSSCTSGADICTDSEPCRH